MSTTKNDGGPAFPTQPTVMTPIAQNEGDKTKWIQTFSGAQNGLSLRDWFAGQALAGIMSSRGFTPYRSGLQGHEIGHLTKSAYQLADAMLEARQ